MTLNSISLNFQKISRDFADFGRNKPTTAKRMEIDQYCQRQRCKHAELEQFLADRTNGRAIGTVLRLSVCL